MTEHTQQVEPSEAESDAAFDSGFNVSRGIEPTPELKEEQPPQEETPPPQEPTEQVEAPATADAPWKAELDSIREQLGSLAKIPDRLRAFEGNLGGLSQLTKELKAAVASAATAARESGKETPTQAQIEYAAQSPERWKAFKEDFPDFADLLGQEIGAVRAEIEAAKKAVPQVDTSALKGEIAAEFEARLAAAVKDAEDRATVRSFLDFHHDGWQATVQTPEFETWWKLQPATVQALSGSDNKHDAKKMLDLYAAYQKEAAKKSEQNSRLERAIAPKGTVVTQAIEDEDAAFDRGFKKGLSG